MRIIDAHIHIYHHTAVEDLLKVADRNGIERLCFSALGAVELEPPLANASGKPHTFQGWDESEPKENNLCIADI